MKEQFKEINFKPASLERIRIINKIIDDYQAQGLRLTLRQTYYQLVSANEIKNEERSYKNLGGLISDARLAGMMDWEAIEDRARQPKTVSEFANLGELAEAALHAYRLPRWKGQDTYAELWVEKDALAGVLQPLAREFHVTMMVNKGYCVDPATLVLMSDLSWVRASEIRPGQTLIGVDEEVPGPKKHRRMRMAVVESTNQFISPRVRVFTDRGSIVVSSNHPFLATKYDRPAVNGYYWVHAENLKPGCRIAFLAEPWEADQTWEAGWLAGIYDGEACLPRTSLSRVMSVYQKPGIVADQIREALLQHGWLDGELTAGRSGVIDFRTYSAPKILELLGRVRPQRLLAEFQKQVNRGVWPAKGKSPATVLSVESLPAGVVVGLETSTKTLITDGFVSHNSSQSAMYESSKRFLEHEDKHQVLFYLGDHDPSGEDMVRDIRDRLVLFGVDDIEVEKLALTMTQVRRFNPPPNPTKVTDSRATGYVEKHGMHSWEVDALPPLELAKIIRAAFKKVIDVDLMNEVKKHEIRDKTRLKAAVHDIMQEDSEEDEDLDDEEDKKAEEGQLDEDLKKHDEDEDKEDDGDEPADDAT